jgi:hypothetical protein
VLRYTLGRDGGLALDLHVLAGGAQPDFLPRVGLTLTLPGACEQLTWYGRGPQETYVDRKLGAQMGVHISAHHYTAQELTAASHTHTLPWREEVVLNLDAVQGGLGNGSCGPGVLTRYMLTPGEHRLRVTFYPLG